MIIQKEEFKKIITEYQDFCEIFDILYHDLKIELINSDLHEYPCKLFELIMSKSFNEVGQDWISYYLYEVPFLNGEEIPLNNVDDLWELVKDERI